MKKIRVSAIFFVAVLFALSACTKNTGKSGKVRSIGKTSEILVVVENEQQWEKSIGTAIREYFGKDQQGLPQPEPLFDLARVTKTSFSDLLKKHRNIFIVEIDKNSLEPKIEIVRNHWAEPQMVIRITAPNKDIFLQTFEKNAGLFIEKYNQTERERIATLFKSTPNKEAVRKIKQSFGLEMIVPRDFRLVKSEPDFIWIRKETTDYSQGFFIFKEAYKDTAQFSKASINARTKRFLQQYVAGPTEGSYMTLDETYYKPESVMVTDFFTEYAVEVRGFWDVENDFMGGPYVSYTFTNPEHEWIFTMFGYVYHPSKEKRNLLRQVEALLYSSKFAKQ